MGKWASALKSRLTFRAVEFTDGFRWVSEDLQKNARNGRGRLAREVVTWVLKTRRSVPRSAPPLELNPAVPPLGSGMGSALKPAILAAGAHSGRLSLCEVHLALLPFEHGQPLAHFFELYHCHPSRALRLFLDSRPVPTAV